MLECVRELALDRARNRDMHMNNNFSEERLTNLRVYASSCVHSSLTCERDISFHKFDLARNKNEVEKTCTSLLKVLMEFWSLFLISVSFPFRFVLDSLILSVCPKVSTEHIMSVQYLKTVVKQCGYMPLYIYIYLCFI